MVPFGFLTLLAALAWSPAPQARPARAPAEILWLGLFTADLVSWLENEQRIRESCTGAEGSDEWNACRESRLEPKLDVLPVHVDPDPAARHVGEIVMLALPGKGLKVFVAAGGQASQFTPDLYDADWGYGPWFHQTVLERRGGWFRLALPSIGRGWVDLRPQGGVEDRLQRLDAGDIVTIPDGDMVFLGAQGDRLRFRAEQEADMWCEEGEPPALAPSQELSIPLDRLRDGDGRLRIRYKYTRGC